MVGVALDAPGRHAVTMIYRPGLAAEHDHADLSRREQERVQRLLDTPPPDGVPVRAVWSDVRQRLGLAIRRWTDDERG